MKNNMKRKLLNCSSFEEFKKICKKYNINKIPKNIEISNHLNVLLSSNLKITEDEMYRKINK